MTRQRPVRKTYPGRTLGLVEWSKEDFDKLRASIQAEPGLWDAYLEAEDAQGFITNEMNDLFLERALALFPEYALKDRRKLIFNRQLQAAAVDLRFRSFEERDFHLWRPSNRDERQKLWSSYVKTAGLFVHRNGVVEWPDERTQVLIDHLQVVNPVAWRKFCWRLENVGFIGLELEVEMRRPTPELFSLPHDLYDWSILEAMTDLMMRVLNFRMLREENRELWLRLNSEYLEYRTTDRSFEQWYEESSVLDEIGRPSPIDS